MRTILLAILITAAISLTGKAEAVLELDVEKIDFGYVPQNSNLFHKVTLKSTGDEPVEISEIETHCKCIVMPLDTMVIEPGDSLTSEIFFFSSTFVGKKEWRIHIMSNAVENRVQIRILATVVGDTRNLPVISVHPHSVAAAQLGDNVAKEFPIQIINKIEQNVPLKLIYTDTEFFSLEFPAFVPPLDTARGILILNENGLVSEFEKSITFEFINDKSEKYNYSIPVRRRIFKTE